MMIIVFALHLIFDGGFFFEMLWLLQDLINWVQREHFLFHCDTLDHLKFLFPSPTADLERALIHSACLAEVFRHHLSLRLLLDFITGREKKKAVLFGLQHRTVVSWGCWINGYWSLESAPLFSSSLGHLLRPQWARQLIFHMKYRPWLGHYSQVDLLKYKYNIWRISSVKEKKFGFFIRSCLYAAFNYAVARRAHCPVLSVRTLA